MYRIRLVLEHILLKEGEVRSVSIWEQTTVSDNIPSLQEASIKFGHMAGACSEEECK